MQFPGKQLPRYNQSGRPPPPPAPGSLGHSCFYCPACPTRSRVGVHLPFRQQPKTVSHTAPAPRRSQLTRGPQLPTQLGPDFARIAKPQRFTLLKALVFFNRKIPGVFVGAFRKAAQLLRTHETPFLAHLFLLPHVHALSSLTICRIRSLCSR